MAELGVIDELMLDIEPVMLGAGMRLFGAHDIMLNLGLIDTKLIGNGTVQHHYKVLS